MENDHVQPYCIWCPDLATEDTYRSLAARYPRMRYQVGRACAVAGYLTLYEELGLLPDVSTGEEAREGQSEGSRATYNHILSQPVRYAIMNDYERSVNEAEPKPGSHLNGDTATRSCLSVTQDVGSFGVGRWVDHYFDLTEDANVGEGFSEENFVPKFPVEQAQLLYLPLPPDLPKTNKDVLILMAAYEGNVDRYARLRRPVAVEDELKCVLRGIYHHTTFAKWWAQCGDDTRWPQSDAWNAILTAVDARFIMNEELSRIWPRPSGTRPYLNPFLIWWPLIPHEATLRELVRRRPDMKLQVALACIAGDYHVTYKSLDVKPHHYLWKQAQVYRANPFYIQDLETRAAEAGIDLRDGVDGPPIGLSGFLAALEPIKEPMTLQMYPGVQVEEWLYDDGLYPEHHNVNANMLETYICASDESRRRAGRDEEHPPPDEYWRIHRNGLDEYSCGHLGSSSD
ncbi:Alpha-mannosyltransferase [Diaporthe eres]|nr:Alpha-mannosyltransferase [Diaporthe eres]